MPARPGDGTSGSRGRSLYAGYELPKEVPKPLNLTAAAVPTGRQWKPNSYASIRARERTGEELMNRRTTFVLVGVTIAALPALAAEVTPERLINADREPQNWLMNHRTYDSQRYSPLDKINKG